MAVGDRIKRVLILRKLTQRELGLAVSFEENTADARIAQYETGTRTPKEDVLRKIKRPRCELLRSLRAFGQYR